jgi:hypothetical protein
MWNNHLNLRKGCLKKFWNLPRWHWSVLSHVSNLARKSLSDVAITSLKPFTEGYLKNWAYVNQPKRRLFITDLINK